MRARALAGALVLAWLAWPARPGVAAAAARRPAAAPAPFEVGADLSSLPAVEEGGVAFRDGDVLATLRAHGFTSVRLRLWHSPADGRCGLPATLAMARRAHAAGLRVLLDLHFSDTWADPGHQATPAAWRALAPGPLADSVHAWTHDAVGALVAQGTPPAAVQVGNEIDAGLLWDTGRVGGAFDTPAQWARLAALLAAASSGVRAAAPGARIVVHLAASGDAAGCTRFLDRLRAARIDYDAIGLSYYPWWHGSLEALRTTMAALARRYCKDVLVVETAYPWTLRWFDDERNLVGTRGQLLPGFPATPEGQAGFAQAVRGALDDVPGGRGRGVWWWEPAWIASPRGRSPWENCALFDSSGALLPAAEALGR